MLSKHKAQESSVEIENHLAYAMLLEIVTNEKIKAVLANIADKIVRQVLQPTRQALLQNNVKTLTDLPLHIQAICETLARQNIEEDIPFGGIAVEFKKPEDITSSLANVHFVLNALERSLDISELRDPASVMVFLKSIADFTVCYYEHEEHLQEFSAIKDLIWPTLEEQDARVLRIEAGQVPQLALSYGVSTTTGQDLAQATEKMGMRSGKALFAGASMQMRLELITKQFDAAVKSGDEKKIQAYTKKMQFYKIPLAESDREPLAIYTQRYSTSFEKTAHLYSLPIIANISRSTARTLITMQDWGVFNEHNQFNFANAQMFANCLMAFYVWGGHHSFFEVAEVYNRLLDYIALRHPEQIDRSIMSTDLVEQRLPYYHYGDYRSFLHSDYAEKIMANHRLENLYLRR